MAGTVVTNQDRSPSSVFDVGLIGGAAGVGLTSALIVVIRPELFVVVLVLDVWLLGYHHVISTFTRFLADRATVRQHLDLLTWWPLAIIGFVLIIGWGLGPWALTTIYLYWQWFHYVRQSWGIARAYERRSATPLPEPAALFTATFYSVPLWGILHRSQQNPDQFLRSDVWTIPVPKLLIDAVGTIAVVLLAASVIVRFRAWQRGQLPMLHTMMVISHLVVFAFGYILISDIDAGWLAINIWHNLQYIAFVWQVNNREGARSPQPGLLHRLSSDGNVLYYLLLSLVASTAIYVALGLTVAAVVSPVIVFQIINFHHYVVDSKIWKTRRSPAQRSLGLS